MLRHDRLRFFLFGALPLCNVAAMLLYGLGLATHGHGGAANSLPFLIVLAALCLLTALWTMIKRGRDLGWPAVLTGGLFWISGPALPLLLGYLLLAPAKQGAESYGPPAPAVTWTSWAWALMHLLWPWALFTVVAATQ